METSAVLPWSQSIMRTKGDKGCVGISLKQNSYYTDTKRAITLGLFLWVEIFGDKVLLASCPTINLDHIKKCIKEGRRGKNDLKKCLEMYKICNSQVGGKA